MTQATKALILAAGLGTRLRPLTVARPKPLFPFHGPTLLDLAIYRILKAGIKDIAVNSHYLSEYVHEHAYALGQKLGFRLRLSYEPELLGTGGALNPIRDWIGDDALVIYNADIVSDCDITALIRLHQTKKPLATLALLPQQKPKTTPVWMHDQRIVGFETTTESRASAHTFTGVHVISPEFLSYIPTSGFIHITDHYIQALKQQAHLHCYLHQGFWHDLGTPEDYVTGLVNFVIHPKNDLDQRVGVSEMNRRLELGYQYVWNPSAHPYAQYPTSAPQKLLKSLSAPMGPHCYVLTNKDIPAKPTEDWKNIVMLAPPSAKNALIKPDHIIDGNISIPIAKSLFTPD